MASEAEVKNLSKKKWSATAKFEMALLALKNEKFGELTVERDFLKKVWRKLSGDADDSK